MIHCVCESEKEGAWERNSIVTPKCEEVGFSDKNATERIINKVN